MELNFHNIAVEVSRREGGVKNLDIAQINEVTRHVLDVLSEFSEAAVILALRKRKEEGKAKRE